MIENSLLVLPYALRRGQASTPERWQENIFHINAVYSPSLGNSIIGIIWHIKNYASIENSVSNYF